MVRVSLRRKSEDQPTALSEVRVYARKIWLAGLGAYTKVGHESSEYFNELVRTGQRLEKKGKHLVEVELDAAGNQIEVLEDNVSSIKERIEQRLDQVERAFDARVSSALNRVGIPSRQDVEALSAKLDELSALLERAALKH